LGIGGAKPFDASIVDKYGYGDCKALVNYTKALLEHLGIESYYTLVKSRKYANDVFTDEVFDQFNHIILCVPDKTDTVWLECTSQMIPFGFLGDFTDNRHVLLITPEGGKIVKTPTYGKEHNKQCRKAEITLGVEGNAEGTVNTSFSGLQYDDNVKIIYITPQEQKELLYKEIDIPSFTIKDFKLEEKKDIIPWLYEHVNLNISKCATAMGNRLLFPANLMEKTGAISSVMKERKTRLRLRYAYIDKDSIIYHLPKGYNIEFMPPPSEVKSDFGVYSSSTFQGSDKKSIVYIRTLSMNSGFFPPEKYKDYIAFRKEISKQDNAKITLIKTP
jgi:hypothetical protein